MVNVTYPLIRNCVLISLGTVGVEVTGNMVLVDNQIEAPTNIYVNSGGRAYVSSVEGITYDGPGDVEPLAGDRSVWDALNYQSRHANDINAATGVHHALASLDGRYISTTLTDTHILVGNASNIATDVAMSSDATIANTGALTLATVNANVGTFGSATQVSQITVNAKGLITAASNVTITAGHTIQDEGAALPTEPNLNFIGSGVIASDDAGNTATRVTIEATFNVYNEIQIGTGVTVYYLANEAEPDTVRAYVNGIRQPAENGATASDVVTFSVAPSVGDTLIFDYELAVT